MSLKRAIIFICVLGTIAIAENAAFYQMRQQHAATVASQIRQEQEQQNFQAQQLQQEQKRQEAERAKAEAARQAAQQAAEEHAQFVARYTDTSFARKPGTKTIAVAVASENATWNSAVGDAFVSRFKNEPVEIASSFFKPAFVSDGVFNDAFADSNDLFNRLELPKSLDGLLLAREHVEYSSDPSLQNVITATMWLDIETLAISSKVRNKTWTFTAAGAGFKRENARAMAEERLIKQIMTDTKMTLN